MLNLNLFEKVIKDYECKYCNQNQAKTFPLLANDSNTIVIQCLKCKHLEFYDYDIVNRNIKK